MSDTNEREPVQGRTVQSENSITHEFPFVDTDGWAEVRVGWQEDKHATERGYWLAECSTQSGCIGCSETSQLHAMADLVRSLAALCTVLLRREGELHRAIHASPDSLAKELRDAENDLHRVQGYITTHVKPTPADNWDEGLRPLWRAERAVEAFAARIAMPAAASDEDAA